MNPELLAFFNQQLAGMLRSGIPLEGALAEISRDMGRGRLKKETSALARDLAAGTELSQALEKRRFPLLYRRLLAIGARAGRLEEVLVMVADHYQDCSMIAARLRSMVLYPFLVLTGAFLLSLLVALGASRFQEGLAPLAAVPEASLVIRIYLIASPVLLGGAWLAALGLLLAPPLRRLACWRLPGLRDGSLSRISSALAVLLRSGIPLGEAVSLVRRLEPHGATGRELDGWRKRLGQGKSRISDVVAPGRSFPPFFVWLVAGSGEALAKGFERAAVHYGRRARHRTDLILTAFLPASVLIVGGLVILQALPMFHFLAGTYNQLFAL